MKKVFLILLSSVVLSGCASIASKSSYDLVINSNPGGADFTVTNRAGKKVFTGNTPASVTLKAGAGYFKNETYTIELNKPGFSQRTYRVTSKLDGWYWGNLFIGGLLGMLVVDPITGAMYKLPEAIDISLEADAELEQDVSLTITTIDTLNADQVATLELVSSH